MKITIKQDRYIRSHGKPLRIHGTTNIAFTNKQSGDVNYKNSKEFFSPKSGSKSDVFLQAKNWAKENGHSTIYIMETMKLTKSELKEIIREEISNIKLNESKYYDREFADWIYDYLNKKHKRILSQMKSRGEDISSYDPSSVFLGSLSYEIEDEFRKHKNMNQSDYWESEYPKKVKKNLEIAMDKLHGKGTFKKALRGNKKR